MLPGLRGGDHSPCPSKPSSAFLVNSMSTINSKKQRKEISSMHSHWEKGQRDSWATTQVHCWSPHRRREKLSWNTDADVAREPSQGVAPAYPDSAPVSGKGFPEAGNLSQGDKFLLWQPSGLSVFSKFFCSSLFQ